SDSPSKNSYIGSYYHTVRKLADSARRQISICILPDVVTVYIYVINCISAVVDALKTLQEKIKRLELERKQAQKNYHQFSQDAQKKQQVTALHTVQNQPAAAELGSKLQSAEARCKVLEKQLDYMRKMVENAKKDKNAFMENQVTQHLKKGIKSEKLEKLESEYLKLSRTQTLAEMKLAILEQNLLKEQHERKLVQEKADEVSTLLTLFQRTMREIKCITQKINGIYKFSI
uniref:Cep57 centrosome localisation domain-containing protein n=1 Tax=Sphaeramia orbicularis TaxID=375764 RepID=A0A672YXI0_9TELE